MNVGHKVEKHGATYLATCSIHSLQWKSSFVHRQNLLRSTRHLQALFLSHALTLNNTISRDVTEMSTCLCGRDTFKWRQCSSLSAVTVGANSRHQPHALFTETEPVGECIHIKPRCCDEIAAFPIYFQWEPRSKAAADVNFCCRPVRHVKLRQAQRFGCRGLRHTAHVSF